MADAAEDIRKLRKIQTPENSPPMPGEGGGWVVPSEHLERWYSKAGGHQRAVNLAQLSQAERVLRGKETGEKSPFPTWRADNLDDRVPVQYVDHPGGRRAEYHVRNTLSDTPKILVDKDLMGDAPGAMNTLEHELLGHHVHMDPSFRDDRSLRADGVPYTVEKMGDTPAARRQSLYLRSPSEVDARLGVIKRRYAYNTGEVVDTPEKAQEALEWFRDNWEPAEGSDDAHEQDHNAANEYLQFPDDVKKHVMQRMTEVVSNHPMDALIRRLS